MKKIEIAADFMAHNLALFACPTCGEQMIIVENNSVICVNGHMLDINKHGYVYFVNHRTGSEYDAQMLTSRRELLQLGLFQPIVDQIKSELPENKQTILDVGCGEGTPLAFLENERNQIDTAVGFDISKAGINLATQLDTEAFFCVADLRKLPFREETFDVMMEIFSPSNYGEFHRVLKPGGTIYKVIPNAGYLKEIRQLLYPNGNHQTYDNSDVLDLFKQNFNNVIISPLQYTFEVPQNLRRQMVEMTPLHWGKNARVLDDQQYESLDYVTVDVSILRAQNN